MAPYRTVERDETVDAPRDQGIVGDVIAQFADPLAFYRELVQNSIDAGSPSVDIRLTHDAGILRVRVTDRGAGMTREILEHQLLVLFRSTKEQDPTKIGKFGIGFTSVLAPNPVLVIVTTVRDGKRLTLHLLPDLTYQLFDGGNASQAGTIVELELAVAAEAAADFATRSYQALVRWCRHASVPIELTAEVPGLAAPLSGRIDRPLGLDDAVLEVRAVSPDGKLTAVVGVERTPRTYTGLFNHGLTLFETAEQLVGKKIACKLQDARLGHTLSRDNVRRDAHFDEAIAFVRGLVADQLTRAAGVALRSAAEASDRRRYADVFHAITAAELRLSAEAWWLPLASPVDGRVARPVAELPDPTWVVTRPCRLAHSFAAAGVPIPLVAYEDVARLAKALPARMFDRTLLRLEDAFVHVRPIELDEDDTALLAELAEILRACNRAPSRILLADLEGAHEMSFALGGGTSEAKFVDDDGAYVLTREDAMKPPIGRFTSGTLVLSASHKLVVGARAGADPRIAASHLARTILLGYGMLDPKRSEVILARGLAALGIGGVR